VRLYCDGKEIHRSDLIERSSVIWYRIGETCDDDSWTISQWQDGTNAKLEGKFADDLVRSIEAGDTVSQVRRKVAEHLGIQDHNRVILIARDGMRSGLVQGDSWEVRQLRKWLCRWLSIDVGRKNGYVILEGLGRQYVYHPEPSYLQRGIELKKLKRWMEQRLFTCVSPSGESDLNLRWVQIALLRNKTRLGSLTPVVWGATYNFELPDDIAEALADDESWLLPATETCIVCSDDKKLTDLPVRTTEGCDHKPTVCKECMSQWIHSSLETSAWDRLKCPECPQFLKFADVKRYASTDDFARYDTLATRAALKDMPNFRWCLSTRCESGQIHDPSCAKFKCAACRSKHCVKHDMPWHSGETCEDYDRRNRRRQKEERASEAEVKKSTRRCPECKKDVHKWTGCNHITCVCRHEWCYICLAPYNRNPQGFLYCRHNPGCTEHDPFVDIIDPPAGRARRHPNNIGGPGAAAAAGRFGFPPPLRPRPWMHHPQAQEAAARRGIPIIPPHFRQPPPPRFFPRPPGAAVDEEGEDLPGRGGNNDGEIPGFDEDDNRRANRHAHVFRQRPAEAGGADGARDHGVLNDVVDVLEDVAEFAEALRRMNEFRV